MFSAGSQSTHAARRSVSCRGWGQLFARQHGLRFLASGISRTGDPLDDRRILHPRVVMQKWEASLKIDFLGWSRPASSFLPAIHVVCCAPSENRDEAETA